MEVDLLKDEFEGKDGPEIWFKAKATCFFYEIQLIPKRNHPPTMFKHRVNHRKSRVETFE